jgi:hypothetical protein
MFRSLVAIIGTFGPKRLEPVQTPLGAGQRMSAVHRYNCVAERNPMEGVCCVSIFESFAKQHRRCCHCCSSIVRVSLSAAVVGSCYSWDGINCHEEWLPLPSRPCLRLLHGERRTKQSKRSQASLPSFYSRHSVARLPCQACRSAGFGRLWAAAAQIQLSPSKGALCSY